MRSRRTNAARRVTAMLAASMAVAVAIPPAAAAQRRDDRVVVQVEVDRDRAGALAGDFDLWAYLPRPGIAILAVDAAELEALRAAGLAPRLDAERTAELATPRSPLPDQVSGIPGYSCYRTVEETYGTLTALVDSHPTLARLLDLGDSWEKLHAGSGGYDVFALVLGNQDLATPKAPFVIIAAMHARELATAELATRFAEQLLAGYGSDPDATWLLDHREIHVVAQLNPDGRKRAEAGDWWRKNADNAFCANSSSRGVDLNRNSSFLWGGTGSSGSQCAETYRGPSAVSEPETAAIEAYLTTVFTDQRGPAMADPAPADATGIFVSLHSFAELVLFPWEGVGNAAPNFGGLQTLGRKMGHFNHYGVCQTCLAATAGTTVDVAYGDYGVAAYTLEIGTTFFQSCATFETIIAPDNLAALRYAAKAARRPYQEPSGPDVRDLVLLPGSVQAGQPVTLTAVTDDTRYDSGGYGNEPTQAIAAVTITLDLPPWLAGPGQAMSAGDGVYDETIEPVVATLDTSGLAPGRHLVFVRAEDAAGNLGVPSAIFLDVTGETIFADGFEGGDTAAWSATVP